MTANGCRRTVLASATVMLLASTVSSAATAMPPDEMRPEPVLRVPASDLEDAFICDEGAGEMADVALLVHGTSVTAEENWSWNYARALRVEGWAVCLITLPDRALDDIQVSSEYVVYAIRETARLARGRIDVIGISQGGLEPRWAARWWPGLRALVDDLVMIATPNHGATFADASCASDCIPALWQTRERSEFLRVLNAGDETPGEITYTSIYSLTDWVIQPATTAELDGGRNIAVQDRCPGRPVEHAQMVYDAVVYAHVMDALRHAGPAEPSRVPDTTCAQLVMPHVGPIDAVEGQAQIYLTAVLVQSVYPKAHAEPRLAAYAQPISTTPSPVVVPGTTAPDPVGQSLPASTVATTLATAVSRPAPEQTSTLATAPTSTRDRQRANSAPEPAAGRSQGWIWVLLGGVVCAGSGRALMHRRPVRRALEGEA